MSTRGNFIVFDDRPSDSRYVERVWRSHSERAGSFHSMATNQWGMVVTRHAGNTYLTVRGPETRATVADCPADGEWMGIQFRLGTFMPGLPLGALRDRRDLTLPDDSGRAFRLDGSAWAYPDFDNAETFVGRLARAGLIAMDPAVDAVLSDEPARSSRRTEQRHFLQATGITLATIRGVERARYATSLLRQGIGILDVVDVAGYFDQPHLTRSVKRLIGQTPAQIAGAEEQLSFLYNTEDSGSAIAAGHGHSDSDRGPRRLSTRERLLLARDHRQRAGDSVSRF